jgi:hypothetical protein
MNRIIAWLGNKFLMVALASALAGCVAETAEDQEMVVGQSGAADTFVLPKLPKEDPGGIKPGTTPGGARQTPSAPSGLSDPGSAQASEPEPQPWKPVVLENLAELRAESVPE